MTDKEIMVECILDAVEIDGIVHSSERLKEMWDKYEWGGDMIVQWSTWELAKILFAYRTDTSRIPTVEIIWEGDADADES